MVFNMGLHIKDVIFSQVKVFRLGLKDRYARSGAAKELLDAYGLSVEDIVNAVKRVKES